MNAFWTLFLLITTSLLTGFTSSHAQASSSFIVTAPKSWSKVNPDLRTDVYEDGSVKTKRSVILETRALGNDNAGSFEFLKANLRSVEEERARFFRIFGLSEYTILNLSKAPTRHAGSAFKEMILMHSRYVNAAGRVVQMFERQFVYERTQFRVVFLEEANSLPEAAKLASILDRFTPRAVKKPGRRAPASETLSGAAPGSVPGSSPANEASTHAALTPIAPPRLSSSEADTTCRDVPPEKRRDFGQIEIITPITLLKAGSICGWDFIKSIGSLAYSIGKIVYNTGRYFGDAEYSAQVRSNVSVAWKELRDHPAETGGRLLNRLYGAASKSLTAFACYKSEYQLAALCNLAIDAYLIYKLLLRLPLSALESKTIASGVQKALAAPVEDGKLIREVASGTRRYETPSGVTVEVSDKPAPIFDSRPPSSSGGPGPSAPAAASDVKLAEKPTNVYGAASYKVEGGSSTNDLAKAARTAEKKFDSDVYVQKFPPGYEKTSAYMLETPYVDRPSIFVPKGTETNASAAAGSINHEMAHVSSSARAANNERLGTVRTVTLETEKGSGYDLMPKIANYKNKYRVDEVYARAVESGVDLKKAEDAVKNGEIVTANHHLELARISMREAADIRKSSDENLRLVINGLKKPGADVRIETVSPTQSRVLVPIETFSPQREKVYRLTKLRNPEAAARMTPDQQHTIQLTIDAPAESLRGQSNEAVVGLLKDAQTDYRRFDAALEQSRARAKALEDQLKAAEADFLDFF